jgi:hypothetical protein
VATFAAENQRQKVDNERSGNMRDKKENQNSMRPYYAGIGVALGVGVGAAIGVAISNIAIGVGIGTGIGVALGGACSMRGKNRDNV